MNFKQYIPEIITVLIVTFLCYALWIQTGRVRDAKQETVQLQIQFDAYIISQRAELQRENEEHLARIAAALQQKEQENENLTSQIIAINTERDNTDSLLQLANARLREALQNADRGNNNSSAEASRMCADMYGKLEERTREAERRAAIYAKFADENSIALRICMSVY